MNTITSLFQQAQLAEAAYANFFDNSGNLITTNAGLVTALTDSKFSQAQATAFANEWSVIDQYNNSSWGGLVGTGFSATVFKNNVTGQYSLAIRGSTGINDFGTDASLIASDGVAVSQLVDMYNYWQRLTHLGVYQAATLTTQYVASGFLSLLYAGSAADVPSSLAALFGGATSISSYDIARAVLLSNGYIVEGSTVYQAGFDLSTNVYTDSRQWGSNTLAGQSVSVDGHSLGGHLAMAFSRLFPSATNSVTAVNGLGFKVADANVNNLFTALGGAPGFDAGKIQNVYGIAGQEFASMNNGVLQQPGAWDGIYIEDGSLLSAQIGGHSASQMTDSLALYNLFAQLAPSLNTATNGIQTITDILKASSNVAANSLESAMTALGKLFGVPGAVVTGNAFDGSGRNLLYTAIAGFNGIVNAPFAVAPTIQSLTGMDAATLAANASDPANLAYRYALVNGNPFVAVGMDYSGFDQSGELDLYNATTNTGNLTDTYLTDRAAMLQASIKANTDDKIVGVSGTTAGWAQQSGEDIYYQDNTADANGGVTTTALYQGNNTTTIPLLGVYATTLASDMRQIKFGSTQGDTLTGGNKADDLYGMAGDDTLSGGKGNDYLEGGKGVDTYAWKSGEGLDTILDSDNTGYLRDDTTTSPIVITGGAQYGDNRVFRGPDANGMNHTYTFVTGNSATGGDLIVDGAMLIKDYQPTAGNHMGITLVDAAPLTAPVIANDFIANPGQRTSAAGTNANDRMQGIPSPMILNSPMYAYGLGGDDILVGSGYHDWLEGGAGADIITGHSANNTMVPSGDSNTDILYGGAGDDRIYADVETDAAMAIANGNPSTGSSGSGRTGAWLSGGAGDDIVVGANDNDILVGGGGSDLLIGGAGNDFISGDATLEFVDGNFDWSFTTQPDIAFTDANDSEWRVAA